MAATMRSADKYIVPFLYCQQLSAYLFVLKDAHVDLESPILQNNPHNLSYLSGFFEFG